MATMDRVWATGKIDTVEVSPTPNSPVRTETITRTVIEPGVYGRLWVGVDNEGWANIAIVPALTDAPEWEAPGDQQRSLNSAELRELARVATELADGLDAQ